jgi:hypothetical protein
MRNRAGITERSPTGTDEVVYSNGTKTKSGGDVVSDSVRAGRGYVCLLPGNVMDKEEFSRALFL